MFSMFLRPSYKKYFSNYGSPLTTVINKTGSASVKGTLVAVHNSIDRAVRIPVAPYDIVGVVYTNGIADGGEIKIITGGLAEILLVDGTASGSAHWMRASSDAYGRGVCTTDPTGLGALTADDHFKEIGHSIQAVSAGTNKLCLTIFHPL